MPSPPRLRRGGAALCLFPCGPCFSSPICLPSLPIFLTQETYPLYPVLPFMKVDRELGLDIEPLCDGCEAPPLNKAFHCDVIAALS